MFLLIHFRYGSIVISSGNNEDNKVVKVPSGTPFEPLFNIVKKNAPPEQIKAVCILPAGYQTLYGTVRLVNILKIMGYRHVQVFTQDYIFLQHVIKKHCLNFKEGEYLLYYAEHDQLCLFQCVNGVVKYQYKTTTLKENEIEQFIKKLRTDSSLSNIIFRHNSSMAKYFSKMDKIFCSYHNLTDSEEIELSISMMTQTIAKSPCGLVQNYILNGPQITCDGNSEFIFDKAEEGMPLPFEWTSEWGLRTKTAIIDFDDWTETITAPKNENYRIVLKLDTNGIPNFYFETANHRKVDLPVKREIPELRISVFISLEDNSFSISKGGETFKESNVQRKPNRDFAFSDVIAMLDFEAPPRKNWVKYLTKSGMEYITTYLNKDAMERAASATTILSWLLHDAIAESEVEWRELALVVPFSFNDRQRMALLKAGEEICDRVFLVDQPEAVLAGIVVEESLREGDKMLSLDNQCLVVAEFTGRDVKILHEQKNIDFLDVDVNKENVGSPTNEILSKSNGAKNSELPNAAVHHLRNSLLEACKLAKTHTDEVKVVLLPKECADAASWISMLNWLFPAAVISAPSNSMLSKLAADGGIVIECTHVCRNTT